MKKALIVIFLMVFVLILGYKVAMLPSLAPPSFPEKEQYTGNESVHNISLKVTYISGETETIDLKYLNPCVEDIDIRLTNEHCIEVVSNCLGANKIVRPACGVRKYEVLSNYKLEYYE